jgi:competence protein ComEC
MMTKSQTFFVILIFFIAGIFTRSFFEIDQNIFFLLLIFAVSILGIFYKNSHTCHAELVSGSLQKTQMLKQVQHDTYLNKKAILFSFVIFFFVFGAWLTDKKIGETQNLFYTGNTFQEKALVLKSSPNAFGQNVIIELEEEKIQLLAQVPKYPEYKYGDWLDVSCTAKAIENKDAEFDYRMYMAKDGILYSCEKPKIYLVAEGRGNIFLSSIYRVRNAFENNIRLVMPQPEGALADGLLFGGSAELSEEIKNDFSRTGMTHIVAVSGYNVTIIAEYLIVLGIFLGLWRKQAIWFAILGIILFVIMSGLPASAVRAGVMGGIILWAMKHGRLASAENAIIFAGAVMLWLNPLLLRWDIGFQLSFLATLGIVASSPFWEKSFIKKQKALGISETIMLSLSAQIFVLPIIAYNFHMTSLVSLLANIFILPIIPLSMLLVFLVSIGGFIFAPLSLVLAWLAFLPLTYEIKMIHFLAQFSWASISIEKVSPGIVFWYYALLALGIFYLKRIRKLSELDENFSGEYLTNRAKRGK